MDLCSLCIFIRENILSKYRLFVQYVRSSKLRFTVITGSIWGILTATFFNVFIEDGFTDILWTVFAYISFLIGGFGYGFALYSLRSWRQKINAKKNREQE
jgi:hypothetical protein